MDTFGTFFKVTLFGESHGQAVGAVIDGVPPGLPIEAGDLPGRYSGVRQEQGKQVFRQGRKTISRKYWAGFTTVVPLGRHWP